MYRTWIALLVGSMALTGCTQEPESADGVTPKVATAPRRVVENPIGRVGEAPIGELDLLRAASTAVPEDGKAHSDAEVDALVDQLVVDEMLVQEALAQGLHGDSKIRRMLATLLVRQEVYGKVSATDFAEAELKSYFDEHKADFIVPERVQTRRIALPVGNDPKATLARATEIHDEIQAVLETALAEQKASVNGRITTLPKTVVRVFERLAKANSVGQYAKRGGDLGLLSDEGKPGVESEVVTAAFAAEPRTLVAPFEANGHVHILLIEAKRPRTERTFEQMRGSILRIVRQQRFDELRTQYLDGLRVKYPSTIETEKVRAVDLSKRPSVRRDLPTHTPHEGHNH